jgi:predicted RNase H-like nuclease (RuvC/YqgF family)
MLQVMKKDIDLTQKKIRTGFIAQEVEKTAKEIGYDFDGVNSPQNEKDNYSIAYADFVPSLVKAVQELSKKNDEKDTKIDALEKRIDKLEALMNAQQSSANSTPQTEKPANVSSLEQNIPNPFNKSTTLNFSLPQQYSNALMIVTDKSGKTIKEINISGSSKGSVQFDASSISNGTYHYSLYVDGKMIESKQMVLAR